MKRNLLNRSRTVATAALIFACAFTFAACTHLGSTSTTNQTETDTQSPATDDSMAISPEVDLITQQDADLAAIESGDAASTGVRDPETGIRTVTIEAGSFYYKPDVIRVKKGEKVKLVLNSVDMMHDFNIDELGVSVPVTKAETSSTVEFTPDQVGTFEYYCSVGEHRANGQVGTIIIE